MSKSKHTEVQMIAALKQLAASRSICIDNLAGSVPLSPGRPTRRAHVEGFLGESRKRA